MFWCFICELIYWNTMTGDMINDETGLLLEYWLESEDIDHFDDLL